MEREYCGFQDFEEEPSKIIESEIRSSGDLKNPKFEWNPRRSYLMERLQKEDKERVLAVLADLMDERGIIVADVEGNDSIQRKEKFYLRLLGLIKRATKPDRQRKIKGTQPVASAFKHPQAKKREDRKRHIGEIKAGRQSRWEASFED